MRLIGAIVLLSSLAALSGCATTMNEQACLVTDWHTVGFEDGASGRAESSIAGYRQACSRHGVAPDLAQYRAGHAEGVEIYCRAGNGFEIGHNGYRYQGVCPTGLESGFLAAYAEGRGLYELEAELRAVDSQIAARYQRIEQIKRDLAASGVALIAEGTSATERAELLLNSATLAEEQDDLADEITALEIERARIEADLAAYRETLAYLF